jgi:TonB-dependent SusC/RagA subfamily outer membrane receptor
MFRAKKSCQKLVGSAGFVLILLFVFISVLPSYGESVSNEKIQKNIEQQNVKVKGTVYDQAGIPLPGVSIIIQGTTTGAVTDVNGNFELSAPENSILMVSFIGFSTQQLVVTSASTTFSVQLKEAIESLDEVVVIGYGTQKKETVTGSMSTVTSEELTQQPVSNIS